MTTSKHIINVPFIPDDGDGNQCVQGCLRMIAKYYDIEIPSWKEANELCNKQPGEWTWPYQVINAYLKLGLTVQYYTTEDPQSYLGGIPVWEEKFGKQNVEKMLKYTNVDAVLHAIKEMQKHNVTHIKQLSEKELVDFLNQDIPVQISIDANVITGKNEPFQGHDLLLTGYDEKHFYCHDTGPTQPMAYRKIPRKLLIKAWSATGTDNDTIVIKQ